jgi:hypothetical protein
LSRSHAGTARFGTYGSAGRNSEPDFRIVGGNPQYEAAYNAKPSRKNETTDDQDEVFLRSVTATGAFASITSDRLVWRSLSSGVRPLSNHSALARLEPPANFVTLPRDANGFVMRRPTSCSSRNGLFRDRHIVSRMPELQGRASNAHFRQYGRATPGLGAWPASASGG